jgi:hypothetical protein
MLARYPIAFNPMHARYEATMNLMLARHIKESATKGGHVRAEKLTEEKRKEIASEAAKARWKKEKENNNNGLRSTQRAIVPAHAGFPKPIPFGV